jgi:hypothetical protein
LDDARARDSRAHGFTLEFAKTLGEEVEKEANIGDHADGLD